MEFSSSSISKPSSSQHFVAVSITQYILICQSNCRCSKQSQKRCKMSTADYQLASPWEKTALALLTSVMSLISLTSMNSSACLKCQLLWIWAYLTRWRCDTGCVSCSALSACFMGQWRAHLRWMVCPLTEGIRWCNSQRGRTPGLAHIGDGHLSDEQLFLSDLRAGGELIIHKAKGLNEERDCTGCLTFQNTNQSPPQQCKMIILGSVVELGFPGHFSNLTPTTTRTLLLFLDDDGRKIPGG